MASTEPEKPAPGAMSPLEEPAAPNASGAAGKTDIEIETETETEAGSSPHNSDHNNYDPKAVDDVEQQGTTNALARVVSKFGDRPACFANTLQEVSFVFMATVATATTSFLGGTAQIITVAVSQDLGMTQGQVAWITASTSLVAGAFQLPLGQLADLLGRKLLFVSGLGLFSACALLVAFARDPFWLLCVCGALGLFSAMVVPPAIGILGAAYARPSRRKNVAFSAFSSGNPLGFAFGTILCGVAVSLSSWRAAFVLLCIIWAVFTVIAVWAVPGAVESFGGGGSGSNSHTAAPPQPPFRERLGALRHFDYVGTVLTVFGTGMLTAGLTLGPEDGWASAQVIALLVVGVVALVVFVFWERVFRTPLMPPHIWKDRNFSFIILVVLLGNMGFTSITFPDSKYWAFMFPGFILNVAGADFQFNVANIYVMQSLPSHQQSLAGGIFNVVIRLSQAVVMGISTAVFSSVELTPKGIEDPMVKYTRTFQVAVALAALSLVFSPFIRLGTQGNTPKDPEMEHMTEKSSDGTTAET
ncbi:hypothetical protein SLS62_003899 [Diatrype stigma]|uniref:Major facilitator superfamily (MFS) profile domain-containing protein n=1 Tax=Diatrype stigma TaxID=117547 RepID=A0AAN9YPK5_9PEZI